MKLTPHVLRAVAVVGVATVAPLLAAIPAHAGAGVPQAPGADVLTMRKAGGVGGEYVADVPPGPNADIIAI